MSKTRSADKSTTIELTFRGLLVEQLKLQEEAQKKDAQQPQINEIQSSSSFLSAEIESAIASVMGQDQAIARTPENIAKAQAYLK